MAEERNLVMPRHVAIILDGNGRWAKSKGMPRNYGHVQGAKTVEVICEEAYRMGIRYLTVYAFSTENWSRPREEVDALMKLLRNYMKTCLKTAAKNDMKMYFRMLCHLADCFPRSWLCTLDADDEYEPDFFARGLALAEAHELDIVACGTQLIQKRQAGDREGTLMSRRQLEEDLIVREGELTSLFPTYKPFFNEMWGKLFHARLLNPPPRHNPGHRHPLRDQPQIFPVPAAPGHQRHDPGQRGRREAEGETSGKEPFLRL